MATGGVGTEPPYVMVAAIDFGTTFSGYAFSFKGSETDIQINKNWGDAAGFQSYKTSTTVLLKGRNLEFDEFGYEAEEKYMEPADEDEPEKNLYRHFKMILHKTEELTLKTVLCSTDGQITPAIDIFTHALRYLKDHLLEQLAQELTSPPDADMIRWVITVPAIWSEQSKQFMREAAYRSGCITAKDSRQLVIALEPEAASFYCRQQDLVKFKEGDISFPSGTKYLVLDCGGGTNDMVVHEVVVDEAIKEILSVTGGSHGGTCIEEKFVSLLKKTLGEEFTVNFQREFPDQWFSFLTRFERLKKKAKNDGKTKLSVELPFAMDSTYTVTYPGKRLKDAFACTGPDGMKFSNGTLILSNSAVMSLFKETTESIAKEVRDIYHNPTVQPLKYMFMVGGFSENPFLQDAIKSEFGSNGCKVLVPREAQLAIIKGAVLYGHRHHQIISRIARKTYGIRTNPIYNTEIHDLSKTYNYADGTKRCSIFRPLVKIGEELPVGASKEILGNMVVKQMIMTVDFYSLSRTPHSTVEYIDTPDLIHLGTITITRPDSDTGTTRNYKAKMTFVSTEILAEVIDDATGKTISKTLDLLNA